MCWGMFAILVLTSSPVSEPVRNEDQNMLLYVQNNVGSRKHIHTGYRYIVFPVFFLLRPSSFIIKIVISMRESSSEPGRGESGNVTVKYEIISNEQFQLSTCT